MVIRRVEQKEDGSIIESNTEIDETMLTYDFYNDEDEFYNVFSEWINKNFIGIDDFNEFDARLAQATDNFEFKELNRRWLEIDTERRERLNGGK